MDDLKLLKKHYGENMMHLCRSLFPTILETPGLLYSLISSNFYHSRFLYDDLVNYNRVNKFKDFIYSYVNGVEEERITTDKTPYELFDEIGYTLYECKTEEDIQKFKKYYKVNEALCTFNGGRLKSNHVFFAVRKDVDNIKREDFHFPRRQDEYGTSVISIQFTRGTVNSLSIKNRYNHTIKNSDATFSNNLENIVPGLTDSFTKYYNFNINQNEKSFELDGYVRANDGKHYKYNYEINNRYYCTDNIIVSGGDVISFKDSAERYIVFDYFILDLMEKRLFLYDEFVYDVFNKDFEYIENIKITKDKVSNNRVIEIKLKDYDELVVIKIDKYNRMIEYKNNNLTQLNTTYLFNNIYLEKIEMSNVKYINNLVLFNNMNLNTILFDNVISIGYSFMYRNNIIKELIFNNLIRVEHEFLKNNNSVVLLDCENLVEVGNYFMPYNEILKNVNLPNIVIKGKYYFKNNRYVRRVTMNDFDIKKTKLLIKNKINKFKKF